jgi:3',5'-nucleoside bisphosphate phosphatase
LHPAGIIGSAHNIFYVVYKCCSFSGGRRFIHGVFVSEGGRFDLGEVELRDIHRGARFFYDSHVHTTASDGERTPQELAFEAYCGGYTVVVTDHYSVSGAQEASEEFERLRRVGGESAGVCGILSGIEVSAHVDMSEIRQIKKLHILGVGVDDRFRGLSDWLERYKRLRKSDIGHAVEVKDDLEGRGFAFNSNLEQRLTRKRNVYQVLVESFFGRPENRRLIERHFGMRVCNVDSRAKRRKKNAQTRRKIVKIMRGRYGDFNAKKPLLEDVVDLIKRSGGLAVVAHPVVSVPQMPHYSQRKLTEVFMQLKGFGIDGVEAYAPTHRLEVADMIAKSALEAGLLVTGGSDTHRRNQEIGTLCQYNTR